VSPVPVPGRRLKAGDLGTATAPSDGSAELGSEGLSPASPVSPVFRANMGLGTIPGSNGHRGAAPGDDMGEVIS
jgi:hypothetical protein